MAGYSGTPLPKKLGIKERSRILLVSEPPGFRNELGELPEDVVTVAPRGRGQADVVVLFVRERADLARRFAGLAARLDPAGGFWIAWPKKASGEPTDLSEPVVRELGLASGLVDNKICAVDEVWSGLRFVVRLVDRPRRAPAR